MSVMQDKDRILVSDSQEEQPRQNSRTPSPSITPPTILDSQDEAAGLTMAGSIRKQKAVSRRPGGAQSSACPALSPTKRKRRSRVSWSRPRGDDGYTAYNKATRGQQKRFGSRSHAAGTVGI